MENAKQREPDEDNENTIWRENRLEYYQDKLTDAERILEIAQRDVIYSQKKLAEFKEEYK